MRHLRNDGKMVSNFAEIESGNTHSASTLIKYAKLHQAHTVELTHPLALLIWEDRMRLIFLILTFTLTNEARYAYWSGRRRYHGPSKRFQMQESWLSDILHRALGNNFIDGSTLKLTLWSQITTSNYYWIDATTGIIDNCTSHLYTFLITKSHEGSKIPLMVLFTHIDWS